MLTCQDLSINRNSNTLFQKLGFTVLPGGCVVVYGPNGSGKTSLLRSLATLSPAGGKILFNEVDIEEALSEYKSLICYIGHKNSLNPELTVKENLKFWAAINNREISLDAALRGFNLEPYVDTHVHKLSKGWQRKVALSRLLLTNAPVWLLDEPFANLDTQGVDQMYNLINIRCQQSGMVLLTSHKPVELSKAMHLNLEDYR